jgi:hypothetical protein
MKTNSGSKIDSLPKHPVSGPVENFKSVDVQSPVSASESRADCMSEFKMDTKSVSENGISFRYWSRNEDGASIWHSRSLGTISLSKLEIDTESGYTVTRHATLESYSIPARLLSIGLFTKRLICPRVHKKSKITTRINTVWKRTKRNPRNHPNL